MAAPTTNAPLRVVIRRDYSDSDVEEPQEPKQRATKRLTKKLFKRGTPKVEKQPRGEQEGEHGMSRSGSAEMHFRDWGDYESFPGSRGSFSDGSISGAEQEPWEDEREADGLWDEDDQEPDDAYHNTPLPRFHNTARLTAVDRSYTTGSYRDDISGDALDSTTRATARLRRVSEKKPSAPNWRSSTGSDAPEGSAVKKKSRRKLRPLRPKLNKSEQQQQQDAQDLRMDHESEAMDQAIAQMRSALGNEHEDVRQFELELGEAGGSGSGELIVGESVREVAQKSGAMRPQDEPLSALRATQTGGGPNKRKSTSMIRATRKKTSVWGAVKGALLMSSRNPAHNSHMLTADALSSLNVNEPEDSVKDNKSFLYDLDGEGASELGSGSAGYTKRMTETLPRVRLVLDEGSWVAQKFNGCLMEWRKVKLTKLNPMQREVSRVVHNIGSKAIGGDSADNMPVNIQLVELGSAGLPSTELHAPEPVDASSSPLSVSTGRRAQLKEEDLLGKQIHFHLLSTMAREELDVGANKRVYSKIILSYSKQWRTQSKNSSEVVHWGETFVIDVPQLAAADWSLVVQLWDVQSRFLGEAEIDFRAHTEDLLKAQPGSVRGYAVQMTAENDAGRQYTGKVRYAMWARTSSWWSQDVTALTNEAFKAQATEQAQGKAPPQQQQKEQQQQQQQQGGSRHEADWMPSTSLWLPRGVPRPFPSVVHLLNGTLYEDPLVTFLYVKIVKIRGRRGGVRSTPRLKRNQDSRNVRHKRSVSTSTAASASAAAAAAKKSWANAKEAVNNLYASTSIRNQKLLGPNASVGSQSDLLDALESSILESEWEDEEDDEEDDESMATGQEAALETLKYELRVSCRGVRKVFTFQGPPDLKDFATVNAAMVFPISNSLIGHETIRITIRRNRRFVADAHIGVQALLDSIKRLSNTHEEGILWNLPGQWLGESSAVGEVLLCYGAANSDHRGGLAESQKAEAEPSQIAEPSQRLPMVPARSSKHQVNKEAPISKGAPGRIGEVGPMGYIKVILHSLALEEATACFCVVRCSNYWLKSATTVLQPWRELGFVVPMWVQDEHLTLAVFKANPIGIRNSMPLIGKLKFRISSLKPGNELTTDFPLEMEGTAKGSANITLAWRYSKIGMLLRSYAKPRQPDNLWYLGIHEIVKDMDKEVLNISMKWLDSTAHPSIPALVTKKTLSTARDEFKIETAKKNWGRIMNTINSIKHAAAAFDRLAVWTEPWKTVLTILGCWLFIFRPNVVLSIGAVGIAIASLRAGRPLKPDKTGSAEQESDGSPTKAKEVEAPATGFMGRYNKMTEFGLMIQNILDDIASGAEQLQALTNWRDPTTSLLVCSILLLAAPVLYLVGLRLLLCFGVFWALRPPALRDPIEPPPAVFFKQLPTQFRSLLAADMMMHRDDGNDPSVREAQPNSP